MMLAIRASSSAANEIFCSARDKASFKVPSNKSNVSFTLITRRSVCSRYPLTPSPSTPRSLFASGSVLGASKLSFVKIALVSFTQMDTARLISLYKDNHLFRSSIRLRIDTTDSDSLQRFAIDSNCIKSSCMTSPCSTLWEYKRCINSRCSSLNGVLLKPFPPSCSATAWTWV